MFALNKVPGMTAASIALLLLPAMPSRAQAAGVPEKIGPWYREIQVDAFLSASYTHNFNDPPARENAFRVFDLKEDQAELDLASLTIQKAAANPGDLGFRVDMGAGTAQPPVTAARGLFRSATTGEAGHFDVQQAYVSFVAPVGRGLRFDLGKFYAPIGYESVERYDAYNDNFSHSFLFGYSAPFTTTGLKITYPLSDKWTGMVMVAQGWDVVSDNNDGKSIEAQMAYASGLLTLTLSYLGGPEQPHDASNWRNVTDFCATWKVISALSLGLNADYGYERNALGAGINGKWYGASAYAVCTFSDKVQLALRAEQFNDPQGARTGTAQRLRAITLTPSWKMAPRVVLRADLREDWSNQAVFSGDSHSRKSQPTAALNVLFVF